MSALDDLSDDELLARLVNHGCAQDVAEAWVRLREEDSVRVLITEGLRLEDDDTC